MDKNIIGTYHVGEKEMSIVLKDDTIYIEVNNELKVCEKEDFEAMQYSMKYPWDKVRFSSIQVEDNLYQSTYLSIVYDFVWIRIYGYGSTPDESTCNLLENIMSIMCGLEYEEDE